MEKPYIDDLGSNDFRLIAFSPFTERYRIAGDEPGASYSTLNEAVHMRDRLESAGQLKMKKHRAERATAIRTHGDGRFFGSHLLETR